MIDSPPKTVFMKPSEIRFSCDTIPSQFVDKTDIHQTILKLTLHSQLINTIPIMTVSNRNDGEWHTENNRRLYMFRVLEKNGVLDTVEVEMSDRLIVPFTGDDGCHIIIRGKVKTIPHCPCQF